MILQSLFEYYERKADLGEIAPIGFEWKQIPFLLIIDSNGNLKRLHDTRERLENKLVAKSFLVPQAVGRSGSAAWKKTNLLWDHYGYVLGYPKGDALKDRKKRNSLLQGIKTENLFLIEYQKSEKLLSRLSTTELEQLATELKKEKLNKEIKTLINNIKTLVKSFSDSKKQFQTFVSALDKLPSEILEEPAVKAIKNFYKKEEYKNVFLLDNWLECAAIAGANLTFQLEGDHRLILTKNFVFAYQKKQALTPDFKENKKMFCLVSGNTDYIDRIHNPTPIRGGQATGKLVGFQKNSGFDSYGKQQAYNAPVGRYSQIAYTAALNSLTSSENNRVFLGDTTTVFWSEKTNIVEKTIPLVLTKSKDDPDKKIQAVKQLYQSIDSGKLSTEGKNRFYVLGLAPNAARISVRFWLTGTVAEFAQHIKRHFDDLEIVRDKDTPEFFALNSMLSHASLNYKLENLAPNLAGQTTESILKGFPYPQTLFHATIRRVRAEQHITRVRAAVIKACINRYNRFYHKSEEEIKVALDTSNKSPAYLLGRLFAVLERVQSKALGIETIRERYYGAFSSTPVTVFPQLMKLKNHHLAKLDSGKNFFEKLIGEIVDGLDGSGDIPRQLSLNDQGRFAVGYYHQRQALKYPDNKTQISEENKDD